MNVLVSVIIPNYNYAHFLDERIQSILNQTYQDFEVIILDDNSTDNSVDVINRYKDNPHVTHLVVNSTNSGSPFSQWKKGIDLAKGDWIWIAESDDSCDSLFLSRMTEKILPDVSVIFCRSIRYDEHGRKFETYENGLWPNTWDGSVFVRQFLSISNVIHNASSVLFRKDKALQLSLDYTQYKGVGDWMFWINLSLTGKVVFVNETLNYFRRHHTNVTERLMEDGISFVEIKRVADYLKFNGLMTEHTMRKIEYENYVRYKKLIFPTPQQQKIVSQSWNFGFRHKLWYRAQNLYKRIGYKFNFI